MELGKQTRLLTERVIRETKRLRNACKMAKCRNSKAGASKEPFEVDPAEDHYAKKDIPNVRRMIVLDLLNTIKINEWSLIVKPKI